MRRILLSVILINLVFMHMHTLRGSADSFISGWLKGVGVAYGIYAGGIIAHHVGSALVAKILTGQSPKVFLGASSYQDEHKKPLASFMGFKLFSPFIIGKKNFTVVEEKNTSSALKNVIMNISGPLANIVCSALALKYLSSLAEFRPDLIGTQLLCAASLYGNIFSEIACNILPIKAVDDQHIDNQGYNIAQELNAANSSLIKMLNKKSLLSRMTRSLLSVGCSSIIAHNLYVQPILNPKGYYPEYQLGRITSLILGGLVAASSFSVNTLQHLLNK